jgi:transposase
MTEPNAGKAVEQDRAQVSELAKRSQEETGETVEIAFVDQGYRGENAADAAEEQGIKLEVAPLPTANRGFVMLPRRRVVGRSFWDGWLGFADWLATMSDYPKR